MSSRTGGARQSFAMARLNLKVGLCNNPPLTYIYVSCKLSKKIDKYGENGPLLLAQKWLPKYKLTDFEGLYNEIKQITEDETALKKIMWNETGLFIKTSSFVEGLLMNKKFLVDSEKITKLCEEGKFEEALQKTLEIPPDYQAAKEKTLKNFALAFINKEDYKNASLAISHLPEGNEKKALKLKCDGNYTEPKKIKQPLTLKNVLETFHKVVPYGIGSNSQKILNEKSQSLFKEWSPIYSLDECMKLVKEAELAEQNGEKDPLLPMALPFARGLTVTVVAETLMETGKYVESMKVISEIHIPQEQTQAIAKGLLQDCKNCGDMQSAVVILTYIPEGEEKNQIAKELGISQVMKAMKPLLGAKTIKPEDINFDLEKMKQSEMGKQAQERLNKLLELDLETLKLRLAESQRKLAQYTKDKDLVIQTNPNNVKLVKETLDKYFNEQEEVIFIQGAIQRKENPQTEEEDEVKIPTNELSKLTLEEEEKSESPKVEKKRSESPPPKVPKKKKDNCIIS